MKTCSKHDISKSLLINLKICRIADLMLLFCTITSKLKDSFKKRHFQSLKKVPRARPETLLSEHSPKGEKRESEPERPALTIPVNSKRSCAALRSPIELKIQPIKPLPLPRRSSKARPNRRRFRRAMVKAMCPSSK